MHVYIQTAWKSYCRNSEKIPGNLLKNPEKSCKYHGILSVGKSGNPAIHDNVWDNKAHLRITNMHFAMIASNALQKYY